MLTYEQSTGAMSDESGLIDIGYSGFAEGLNNPAMQMDHDLGPIPAGDWEIVGPPIETPNHGPFVLRLVVKQGTPTFGRSGLLIHGDEIAHAGEHIASRGCIILDRATRERIWASGDRDLIVIQ